ncbi:MAG: hypothetical protein CTY31_12545 [Hyphomicrobium sp.]|nr:MAG: hypothetical protein CTY31_12545 [Hyphomicrobium sp.]
MSNQADDLPRPIWALRNLDIDAIYSCDVTPNPDEHVELSGVGLATAALDAGWRLRNDIRPDLRELGRRLEAWALNGCQGSLDAAIQARRHGGLSVSESTRLATRDAILRIIARDDCAGQSRHTASRMIAAKWERYCSDILPRHQQLEHAPPGEWSAYWQLANLGFVEPLGARQIFRVLPIAIQEGL